MKSVKFIPPFVGCVVILLSATSQLNAAVAYTVPAGATSNQNHNGLLGMDFDVIGGGGITVTRLGAFDSGQDGIQGTINVGIVDRTTGTVVGETAAFSGDAGELIDGSRFLTLDTPIILPNGFQGSITAEGYGAEGNGNTGNPIGFSTTDDGDGLITFVGGARWGGDGPLALASNVDGGPANRYFAGTFVFLTEDTDGDGLPDAWEEQFGLKPDDPDDADDDGDGDGLSNLEEFENGTDPTERDTDGDNLTDGEEVKTTMTNPNKRDSDNDGLWDSVETNTGTFASWTGDLNDPSVPQTGDTGSDPNDSNTDDDGFADGEEVAAGFDPNDPNSGPALSFQGVLAIDYLVPGVGTQEFAEGLGHDFLVIDEAIEVTALGVFDSGADGLNRDLTSELWVRDANDVGTLLVSASFTMGTPGLLHNSNRIKSLPTPLVLEPGAYTIVGRGYGAGEPNGNTGGPGPDLKPINDGGGRIEFVGGARWGGGGIGGAVGLPQNIDSGPPVRYAAGTFAFRTEPPPKLVWRISSSGEDLIFEWESKLGKVYDILSNTDLSNTPAEGWPLFREDIPGTPPLNVVTSLRPPDEARYFVLVERDGPPLFDDNFESGEGDWVSEVNDPNGNTTWELGTPAGSSGPMSGANGSVNAWCTNLGNYGPDSDITLRSPAIDLSPAPGAVLACDLFRDADGFADTASICFVRASDQGPLGAPLAIDMIVIDGDWVNQTFPVPPEALGEIIQIEFKFMSDNSDDDFSGLSIDNVSVRFE